jgi:hypothetical protein
LKAVLSRIPREYASYGPAGKSRKVLYPDFWTSGEEISDDWRNRDAIVYQTSRSVRN